MHISVIVAVFNAEKTIEKCVTSLLELDYPSEKLEIIFVDGSTDNTPKILNKYRKDNVKILCQKKQGISAARNIGIANSGGEIIAITDSDCYVERGWLKNIIKGFTDEGIGIVGGSALNYPPSTYLERYIVSLAGNRQGHLSDRKPAVITVNAAYRRKALEISGCFDERLCAAEDIDLSWRIESEGFKIKYEPNAIVYHKNRSRLCGFISQQFRDGKGMAQLRLKYNIHLNLRWGFTKETARFYLFLTAFVSKTALFFFHKKTISEALRPFYDFLREFSYCAGYLQGFISHHISRSQTGTLEPGNKIYKEAIRR